MTMAPQDVALSGCYAVVVSNGWNAEASLQVAFRGATLNIEEFLRLPRQQSKSLTYEPVLDGLKPGEVGMLFLSDFDPGTDNPHVPCPEGINAAVTTANPSPGFETGRGDAFKITSNVPVTLYSVYPFGGGAAYTTGATVLLPTSSWSREYLTVSAHDTGEFFTLGRPWVAYVGYQDDTVLSLRPSTDVQGANGIPAMAAGSTTDLTLNSAEVIFVRQETSLTGSFVRSTKPIGVFGGHDSFCDPGACDADHEMIAPLEALGHVYAAVRPRDRYPDEVETPPWRIVGAVDGTELAYDPYTPEGAPSTISAGEFVTFNADAPFVVRSQGSSHPFHLTGYMEGCANYKFSPIVCRGDPEALQVVPADQFLSQYNFFTDPTYSETHLVLVRQRDEYGFHDVSIKCLGWVQGWEPLSEDFEYARIDLVTGNFESPPGCSNGPQLATSRGRFGLSVWGWGSEIPAQAGGDETRAVSYGYPAGFDLRQLNSTQVPF